MSIGLLSMLCVCGLYGLVPEKNSEQRAYNSDKTGRDLDRLVALRMHRRADLKNIIEATADEDDLEDIQETLEDIQEIEKEYGITDLQKQVGMLRIEACRMQQQEPIRGYLNTINKLVDEIKSITADERARMDDLMSKSMQSDQQDDSNKNDALKERIAKLENIMREKAADQLKAIDELNQKIYQETMQLIDKARPLAKRLEEQYGAIRESLKPLDEKLAQAIGNINASLHESLVRYY